MLTPTYLEQLPEPMIKLISQLQDEIIADITKRIVKGKYDTPSAQWMLYKANQLRLSSADVNKLIAKGANVRERTIRDMYSDSVKLALHDDAEIYRYAISENKLPAENGDKITSYFRDVAHNDFFRRGLKNTQGLMRNLTNSMAAAANRVLPDALDLAWLEVSSGAFTVDEACFKAVTALTAKGLAVVEYKSGHKDQVDVAVRRAVRTGINKTCCDMQLDFAAEMGSDLVEVSSHLGARPTHADWQGQIYSISGKHPKYKPFSVTGYGTGDGLGGWNCRHSFFPYFEGLSIAANMPDFTAEENREMYDNQQQQRAYERAVRKSKRELAGIDAARQAAADPALKDKLDKEFARKSVTLKRREERLEAWCEDKGLQLDSSRVRTAGFGRSVSQKAVWAAKKQLQVPNNTLGSLDNGGGSGIMNYEADISGIRRIVNRMIDRVTDLKEPINMTDLPEGHGEKITDMIDNAPPVIKELLNKYPPQVINYTAKSTPHYSPYDNAIRFDLNKLENDRRGSYTTAFHEAGHFIDHALGTVSSDSKFRKLLDNDFNNLVRYTRSELRRCGYEDSLSSAYTEIGNYINQCCDSRLTNSTKDIICGITNFGCFNTRDSKDYWNNRPNGVCSETFAHFFEATARNDSEKVELLHFFFPSSYDYFIKLLEQ